MAQCVVQVSPDFEFPAQPANADPHLQGEFAVPPVARETEFEAPPVSAHANQAEYEVPPTRTAMPAYHRGPSYASEVDNLAEPQVLREDTILVSQRPFQFILHPCPTSCYHRCDLPAMDAD